MARVVAVRGRMPVVLERTFAMAAPLRTVAAALRHTRTVTTNLGAVAEDPAVPVGELLLAGDRFPVATGAAGDAPALEGTVCRADETAVELRFDSSAGRSGRVRFEPREPESGARSRCEVHLILSEAPEWLLPRLDGYLEAVRELASKWSMRQIVVGAALVEDGMLLAQQRHYPAVHAGRWELPGGRVEPGESESEAVVRECREELGTEVRALERLGTDVPLLGGSGMSLRVLAVCRVAGARLPLPLEHRALRWVGGSELAGLPWLEADRLLLDSLRALLSSGSEPQDPK
ncbi:(deoxy)nucleoside triphosphate pyrophosphohydrolase [Actinopolyspora xinjiangensis]|uniref:(deoxy)nucleoside triphosphate pyrophosphohydrolase n=1 Tax=Actinopolyspora xinjiangensis TaxID=405564 RepID=UPI001B8BCEC2|nr:NUDIX domain-containing protein [Actinopolyspora xinjiangensis]